MIISESTKALSLRMFRQRASELRNKIETHVSPEMRAAFEHWRAQESREANEARVELVEVEKAIAELERA